MHNPYLRQSQPTMYGLRAVCLWWSICSCYNKQKVRCCACLNLSCLRYGCQRCTLAVAHLRRAQRRSIFGKNLNTHLVHSCAHVAVVAARSGSPPQCSTCVLRCVLPSYNYIHLSYQGLLRAFCLMLKIKEFQCHKA